MAAFHGVTGTKVLALNGHWDLFGSWTLRGRRLEYRLVLHGTSHLVLLYGVSPDFWYGYTLIWSRNAQAEDAAGLFSFTVLPFLQQYPYLWSLAISSHETRKAVRHKQPSNTEAPKKEPDRSGPGQPYSTPLH